MADAAHVALTVTLFLGVSGASLVLFGRHMVVNRETRQAERRKSLLSDPSVGLARQVLASCSKCSTRWVLTGTVMAVKPCERHSELLSGVQTGLRRSDYPVIKPDELLFPA